MKFSEEKVRYCIFLDGFFSFCDSEREEECQERDESDCGKGDGDTIVLEKIGKE